MSPVNHSRKLFSLDFRYCSLVSGSVSGSTFFLLLCGLPGWALNMVHPLLWLWLLIHSITTTGFRPCGTVHFDEGTTYAGVTLDLWLAPVRKATLFLLLPVIWYLYQHDYCENGLNRRTGNDPEVMNWCF